MSNMIPDDQKVIETPGPRQGQEYVAAVLEGIDGWGQHATLYDSRFDNAAGHFVLGEGYGVASIVLDVIERLTALGIMHDTRGPSLHAAVTAPHDDGVTIEEAAVWLRDLAAHPRFDDPPHGLGWGALLGQEGNILMAHREAMQRHAQSLTPEINAARDLLLKHAKENPASHHV